MAARIHADPGVLRLNHLETDLRPPVAAIEATRAAAADSACNSYLPMVGRADLRAAVARHVGRMSDTPEAYDPAIQVAITCGGMQGILDVLYAAIDPGDEVIVTDPTHGGFITRIRLAGGVVVFAPLARVDHRWRLDLDALAGAITGRTRAMLLADPVAPSGAVLDRADWALIADLCRERDLWLIQDTAMERIRFDGRTPVPPASLPGMRERTVVVGSVSKEYRMVGWRVGWVVGPPEIMQFVQRITVTNASAPPMLDQVGARAALEAADDGVDAAVVDWQRRRDVVARQLAPFGVAPAEGGWSVVLDVEQFGVDGGTAVARLLDCGVAATSMRLSGMRRSDRLIRLTFGAEPAGRLALLGERVARALAS